MKSFTTKYYNLTYEVGQKGKMYSRFKKDKTGKLVTITGFSKTGAVAYVEDEKGNTYSITTNNLTVRGSHFGNSYVRF